MEDSRFRRHRTALLGWSTVGCAVVVLVASSDYRTIRVWTPNSATGQVGGAMIEGWGSWAGETLLCALAVLAALLLAALTRSEGHRTVAWAPS